MSSDCLVLNISDDSIKLCIMYNPLNDNFWVWGNTIYERDSSNNKDYDNEFVYKCQSNHKKHLHTFIQFILDDEVNLTLYSIPNMPDRCDEITHDLFDETYKCCDTNVITHYNKTILRKKYLFKLLNILKFIKK